MGNTIRQYNAAQDLIERNLDAGRADKIAYIDDSGSYSYAELALRVRKFAGALRKTGLQPEQRVMLCLEDSIAFPVAFLGAIWAGAVPVPVNTLLTSNDYAFMLRHSRAQAVFVSAPNLAAIQAAAPSSVRVIVVDGSDPAGLSFDHFVASGDAMTKPHDSLIDDICFWLYSSGSTGVPKGAVHRQGSLAYTAEHYAQAVLGLREDDRVYSASKLFFAYGLGNGLSFPLAVGATTVLTRQRPTPQTVFEQLQRHRATVFCGVPSLFALMLSWTEAPQADQLAVRICTSAGEGLPRDLGERWHARYGSNILDGLGSTEMLHIFLSNRPGDVHYGTTGSPVPGYALRILGENGEPVADGELGELYVKGGSSAALYWADRERSCATFQGEWTRTGDKYARDADGYYVYGGRSDDMLKVGGIYVSPFEVESALISHPDVLEAAVIGAMDKAGLVKPKAYVVLRAPCAESETLALGETLCAYVKSRLAPYKAPRWVTFVPELPKTATGKVQRFRLRQLESVSASGAP